MSFVEITPETKEEKLKRIHQLRNTEWRNDEEENELLKLKEEIGLEEAEEPKHTAKSEVVQLRIVLENLKLERAKLELEAKIKIEEEKIMKIKNNIQQSTAHQENKPRFPWMRSKSKHYVHRRR